MSSSPTTVAPRRAASYAALITVAALASCAPPDHPPALERGPLTQWVNPFIGTGGHGHTYPGATVPFGMVQVSPDNGRAGWDWSSGYHWSDSVLTGFSHTHLSGTGIGDLLDILVMPVAGPVDLSVDTLPDGTRPYSDRLDHAQERASPGYYAVTLQRSRIQVELTATPRVGLHRITFPEGADPGLVIDLGYHENWDTPTSTELVQVSDTLFLGKRYSKGWANDERIHFALVTSRPVTHVDRVGQPPEERALLHFADAGDQPLLVKVGISYVDEAGALANVEAEAPQWDFDGARARAVDSWEHELSKVRLSGGTPEDKTIFYTALYHTRLAPVLFEDVDGRYRGGDGEIHRAQGFVNYSIFSLWDTFRAANPLNTIIDPARVHDLVASMLAFGDEHGLLPVWLLTANETNTMTGNHAVPVIVDAVLKGLAGVDPKRALAAVVKSQSSDIRDLDDYRKWGWVPSDLGGESVTKTLEYGYDDAAVARLAAFVGDTATARTFRKRSEAWRHEYDPATGFMRGRLTDGSFSQPFDPLRSDHRQNTDYTEGNAWQHSWFVPHDAGGLVAAHGGDTPFVRQLDELFDQDTVITGTHVSADISGLIGQYAHGNEPSHNIAYLYAWAGRPDRIADRVRQILDTQYRVAPDGLSGNEDCGQMSAWYVFSALGFYPADPSSGVYVLGVPRFDEARVRVQHGTFIIRVHRDGPDARYVRSVHLKGRAWPFTYIRHEDVARGGVLEIELGSTPDPVWGHEAWTRPPSDSDPESVVVVREEAEKLARR
ncbi:MAG: GH92 family glycosyl hydrolase [Gemmatimonadetes bacterium]|nr:GH92 family glycosyl hydrolase [Gemmatimonadota bacterium]